MTKLSSDIILYGGPGSGKGTQAEILSKKMGFIHLDMGNEVRRFAKGNSADAKQVKSLIDIGKLIPVRFTKAIAKKIIAKAGDKQNIVFDGYPRHLVQKQNLNILLNEIGREVRMFFIELPDDVALKRLTNRAEIEHRVDDTDPKAISSRLNIFHRNSIRLIDSYRKEKKLVVINGNQSMEKVAQDIAKKIKK